MAEGALGGDNVAAGGDQAGSVEVPEVVKPDVWELCAAVRVARQRQVIALSYISGEDGDDTIDTTQTVAPTVTFLGHQ